MHLSADIFSSLAIALLRLRLRVIQVVAPARPSGLGRLPASDLLTSLPSEALLQVHVELVELRQVRVVVFGLVEYPTVSAGLMYYIT